MNQTELLSLLAIMLSLPVTGPIDSLFHSLDSL